MQQKRGRSVFLLAVVLLFALAAPSVFAGYCANPAEPAFYCSGLDIAQEDCCPVDAAYYGEVGAPASQLDCEDNYYDFTDINVAGLCSDLGCCYIDSAITCDASSLEGACLYDLGTFDPAGCAGPVVGPVCSEGCCIYDDGVAYTSVISSSGYCSDSVSGTFDPTVIDPIVCSDLAAAYVPADVECNDGIDNDGDGAIDYPADSDCSSIADSSEAPPVAVCADGLDNDGDGLVDLDDPGCCGSEETANEELCELAQCSEGSELVSSCNCYDPTAGVTQEEGTYCAAGNFCCDGVCGSEACGLSCSPGEREYCGTTPDACLMYQECQPDGTWGVCEATDSCGGTPEVCDNGVDDDGDGLVDCQDIDCYELSCGVTGDVDACADQGFSPRIDGTYVCCSTADVNDCDEDGIIETCGSCSCAQHPVAPIIDSVNFIHGAAELRVEWTLACSVDFHLRRCSGPDCVTDISGMTPGEVEAAFPEIVGSNIEAWEYTDTTIAPNERYCYVVQGLYDPEDDTYSQPYCIEDSGDALCQTITTSEFCLDDYAGFDERLIYRAQCTAENKVSYLQNCRVDYGSDHICIGPYDDGTTSCEYQSDCQTCGDPLGMYALLDYSVLQNTEDSYYGDLCINIPMCYYDYTQTTANNFDECAEVTSCYDYASQSSCQEQYNEAGFNNKCLQRNCAWANLHDAGEIPQGICKEVTSEYARCDACNSAEHNGVFDACTADRCVEFSVDTNACYLSDLTATCTDIASFTCTSYGDATSCRGDFNVAIDPETHEIIQPSADALGLGICYWDGDSCYKDRNGDGAQDDGQEDLTDPTTEVLSPDKVGAIEVTLLATDQNADGSMGSGVKAVYYCLSEDGLFCHPDELLDLDVSGVGTVVLGDGSGDYALFFYAEDYAENIEVVQSFGFEVDKKAPEITITPFITPDITEPFDDSSITYDIVLDEEAYCTDSFAFGDGQIVDEFNDHFVERYDSLSDGSYLYSIVCVDELGNEGEASIYAHVDADTAVFDPQPTVYADTSSVVLSVKTHDAGAVCGFSEGVEEPTFVDMDEGFDQVEEGDYTLHYREWDLGANGYYFFDVKCELSDGRVSDDQISFVYDDTAPFTSVVDSHGDALDLTAFYAGEDIDVYLSCSDEPPYGFGCDATYYCVDVAECAPDLLYDPTDSIEYDLTDVSRMNVCYYSIEGEYAGLGGLHEDTKCTELKVDLYDPTLSITAPEDMSAVYTPSVTLEGVVGDADATPGTAVNTLYVTLRDTTGVETVFDPYAVTDEPFAFVVDGLTLEQEGEPYNYITAYATDRSGAVTNEVTTLVRYTTEFDEDAIWIVEPTNGVSDTSSFDFVIGTYLEADQCGYSRNDASLEMSIALLPEASDVAGEHFYGAPYSIEEDKEGIGELVYVKCLLENGVEYAAEFILEFDTTAPIIEDLYLANSDGKEPPSIIEPPLDPELVVVTDDRTKCKYSFDASDGFSTGMTRFSGFDDQEYMTVNSDNITGLADVSDYTIYVACQNGAYQTSATEQLSFTIDSTAASGMFLIEPEVTGSRTYSLVLGTTRSATFCNYGESDDAITIPMTEVADREWQSDPITVTEDGIYTYYFSCSFIDGEPVDYFEVIVDTTPPEVDYVEDGEISYSNTSLSAAWEATDDLTYVIGFEYSIGTSPGYDNILNWTETDEEEAVVDDLELEDHETYYWNVRAQNEVELWSASTPSDGVFVDSSASGTDPDLNATTLGEINFHTCSNDKLDDDETDIDCGGACDACLAGSSCDVSDDCASGNCLGGICEASTCFDGIQNQGESDIDCGGNYCETCGEGYACVYHRDCSSGYCEGKVCTAPSCYDGIANGDEEGVDCGGSCGVICEEVVLAPSPPVSKEEVDGDGMSIITWVLLLLVLIALGAGGYYGYIYYMKKQGKLPASYNPLGGLGGIGGKFSKKIGKLPLGKPGPMRPLPKKQVMPGMKQVAGAQAARNKARAQKQQQRSRLMQAFDDKKPTDKLATRVAPQKPMMQPTKKAQVKKPISPTKAKQGTAKPKAPGKLSEKKPVKKVAAPKKKSRTFTELEALIASQKKKKK